MQISPHFHYNELVHTNHTQFKQANFEQGKAYISNMRLGCIYILEPIRARFGKPIYVSSYFRSLELHYYIYGKINERRATKGLEEIPVPLSSQHLKAEVSDFEVKDTPCQKVFEYVQMQNCIKFGQLIWEKDRKKEWIHCSLPTLELNGQVLIFENGKYRRIK